MMSPDYVTGDDFRCMADDLNSAFAQLGKPIEPMVVIMAPKAVLDGVIMRPIDEILKRHKFSAKVADRIRRLNLQGYTPGQAVRGWHPHQFSRGINMEVIGPRAFIARYGRDAYRAIPRDKMVRRGHRKAITREYCMELPNGR